MFHQSLRLASNLPAARTIPATLTVNLLTLRNLQVFHSEAWAGTLIPSEFARVLDKLGLDGNKLSAKLFHAFDLDNSGHLDFKEVFIGMALLLSSSREQQLQSTFDMMDDNGSGRVSQQEISKFLRYICPPQATR